jgi:AcrR family transcriptional regulator
MKAAKGIRSEKTKALILEKALELFREQGFEGTTMRDIAKSARVATGAAYYYFPAKEAIVAAYYDRVQQMHEEKVLEALVGTEDVRTRLRIVLHTKLDILRDDRKFLGALFRYAGEPDHPLSVFGKGTASQRAHSVGIFEAALANVELSRDLRRILPWALWLMHLGAILVFIYDASPGQRRTRALVDGLTDLLWHVLEWASAPMIRAVLGPFQGKLLGILKQAGWPAEN